MIREFNQKWEQDYVRKTVQTRQAQTDRRCIPLEKNAQRTNIDEGMEVGGSHVYGCTLFVDDEEDTSEDEDDDGVGTGLAGNRPET